MDHNEAQEVKEVYNSWKKDKDNQYDQINENAIAEGNVMITNKDNYR